VSAPPFGSDASFGEWLRDQVVDAAFIERDGFFAEQIDRVAARLQRGRRTDRRFEVLVPWIRVRTAFTAPGRYIYVSRGLLERCPHDEAVAFVIAHEMAHHDLGHMDVFSGELARHAVRLAAGQAVVLFFRLLLKRVYSPEWECDADRRAIELCVRAGYDGARCLEIFRVLETMALDMGDLDGVFGLDPDSDEELSPEAGLFSRARMRLWLLRRGYLPIQDREAEVRRHLETVATTGARARPPRP
jgi:predicted Zn-dependent protease